MEKEEKTPYDVLLNQYEPGMTTEILDSVFAQVKDGIMEIRKEIEEKELPLKQISLNYQCQKKFKKNL